MFYIGKLEKNLFKYQGLKNSFQIGGYSSIVLDGSKAIVNEEERTIKKALAKIVTPYRDKSIKVLKLALVLSNKYGLETRIVLSGVWAKHQNGNWVLDVHNFKEQSINHNHRVKTAKLKYFAENPDMIKPISELPESMGNRNDASSDWNQTGWYLGEDNQPLGEVSWNRNSSSWNTGNFIPSLGGKSLPVLSQRVLVKESWYDYNGSGEEYTLYC